MGQKQNLSTPELTITNGTRFHFKSDGISDETVIIAQRNNYFIILNLNSHSLSSIMHYAKYYELWNKLNMSWVYKDMAYPFLFMSH